jgi:hypothetical protein
MNRPVTSRPPIAPLRAPALAPAWAAVVFGLSLGLGAGVPTVAHATEPVAKIAGKTTVPANQGVVLLDGRQSVADPPGALKWKWKGVGPEPTFIVANDQASGRPVLLLLLDPPIGTFRFELIAIGKANDGTVTADADVIDITVSASIPVPPTPTPTPIPTPMPPTPGPVPPTPGPIPTPTPGPTPPTPTPTPVPVASKLWLTMVVDVDAMTPQVAAIGREKPFFDSLASRNVAFRRRDVSDPFIQEKNLTPYVMRAGGAPCLIIQGTDGTVISTAKIPADESGVMSLIDSIRKGEGSTP